MSSFNTTHTGNILNSITSRRPARIAHLLWAGMTVMAGTALACSESIGPIQSVAAVTIVDGNGQTAQVNTSLPLPVRVRVTDAAKQPISGEQIFYVVAGSASNGDPVPQATKTDVNGIAAVSWKMGPVAGSKKMDACTYPPIACVAITATATP